MSDYRLVKYDSAKQAIATCERVDEAKDWSDKAAALAAYARQANDPVLEATARRLRARAFRRMGQISAGLDKASGGDRTKSSTTGTFAVGKQQVLSAAGVSKSTSHRTEKVAAIPDDEFEDILVSDKPPSIIALVNRRKTEKTAPKPLPSETLYGVIYADPPWRYDHSITKSREIENQYPTMTVEEICALPIVDMCAKDSVLFLWSTSPKLAESLQVVQSWGFTYKTCMVWVKDKIGMGYYARQRHELLLIATRGKPGTPAVEDRPDSVIDAPRGRHSQKPLQARETIERMYPNHKRVELFARQMSAGWDSWGNEV